MYISSTLYKSAPEAVVQMCSVKKVFSEISKKSQENTCARVSFLIKLQALGSGAGEFSEIFKNTFLYRTPLVAASAALTFAMNTIKTILYSTCLLCRLLLVDSKAY